MNVIAVIPACNEEKYIENVVNETKKYVSQVIVVDDGSSDSTGDIAKEKGAIVLRHVINLGLGAALKTGCDAAAKLGAKIIVTLDGDGQHDPCEIPKLINALERNNTGIVFGERRFDSSMPFVKKVGNNFFRILSNYFFKIKLKDTQTGYRVFTAETYDKILWNSSDYAVASEILMNAEKNNVSYAGEKIRTIYHENKKGTTIFDGIKITNKMLNLKFNN